MSCCLFGSHTGFLVACNSEQMKLSFRIAFSVCCLFPPSPPPALLPKLSLLSMQTPWKRFIAYTGSASVSAANTKSFQLCQQMCGACGTGRELKVSSPACWEVLHGEEVAGGGRVLPARWAGRAAAPVERLGSPVVLSKALSFCPRKLHTGLVVWQDVCSKFWSSQKCICTKESDLLMFETSSVWDLWQVER